MENRHRDALQRIYEADDALAREGREPDLFQLVHGGGMTRDINHARWDRSWAVPSEHTIDDLHELGFLRVRPSANKARSFTLTMKGRTEGERLVAARRGAGEPPGNEVGDAVAPEPDRAGDPRKVAVMHGRDAAARRAVVDLLRGLGLDPLEWDDLVDRTGKAAPSNAEAVAAAFEEAQAVVVVLTPDDVGFLHPALRGDRELEDDREPTGQARLNVVLEAGMALQSHPVQTVFVEIGRTRQISDLAGINTIRLEGSPEKLNSLANRLASAGCPVKRSGGDWLDTAAFERLDALTREPPPVGGSTAEPDPSDALLRARHVSVELSTIDRTLENALSDGYWWNVAVETLPAVEWATGRDALAQHAPEVYDDVAPVYVEADLMNKAALNHVQGGLDDYDDAIRERLTALRQLVQTARGALRDFVATTEHDGPSPERLGQSGRQALVRQIDALIRDMPDAGYCPLEIAKTYRQLRERVAASSAEGKEVVGQTQAAEDLTGTRRHTRATCPELRVALGQMRAALET